MALNARNGEDMMTLSVKLRTNDGSERQSKDATLNVKLWMTALNAKLWTMTLNTKNSEKMMATLNAET